MLYLLSLSLLPVELDVDFLYLSILTLVNDEHFLCSSSSDLCEHICGEKLRLVLAMVAAIILFPLLVWGGYALIPFDSPRLESAPLRVLYTLRCAFFATIPIMLGETSARSCDAHCAARRTFRAHAWGMRKSCDDYLCLQVWWCRAWPGCATACWSPSTRVTW